MASEMARQAAAEIHGFASIDDVAYWGTRQQENMVSDTLKALARFEAAIRADQVERDAKVAEQIASAKNEDGVQIYKDHVCLGAEMAAAAIRQKGSDHD